MINEALLLQDLPNTKTTTRKRGPTASPLQSSGWLSAFWPVTNSRLELGLRVEEVARGAPHTQLVQLHLGRTNGFGFHADRSIEIASELESSCMISFQACLARARTIPSVRTKDLKYLRCVPPLPPDKHKSSRHQATWKTLQKGLTRGSPEERDECQHKVLEVPASLELVSLSIQSTKLDEFGLEWPNVCECEFKMW